MKTTALIAALLTAATLGYSQVIPPIVYELASDFQQVQELPDQAFVQGAGVSLRYRIKSQDRWLSLAGLGARWDGRSSSTSTQALQAAATAITNVTPHYFQISLTPAQTGSAVTNWVYSLIVTAAGTDYPIGAGALDIAASTWTGAAAVLSNVTSAAYTDAAVSTHAAVKATTNSLGHVIVGAGLSVDGDGVLVGLAGTPAWGDVTGKPFTDLVDLTTNNLTGIPWADIGGGGGGIAFWPPNPPNATNFTWTTNANEITIATWKGTGGNDVVIPDMIDGLPVVAIGEYAFNSGWPAYIASAVASVSGGANVRSIGANAFYRCVQLTSVNLPAATIIGNESFYNCTSLTSVSLPAATSIGVNAFAVCTQLTNVTFSAATVPIGMFGIFAGSTNVVVYVTNPTATGWGPTFSERPVVRLGVTAESATITGTNTAAAFVQNGTNLMTQITTLQSATNSYVLTNSTAAVTVGSLTATGNITAGNMTLGGVTITNWPSGSGGSATNASTLRIDGTNLYDTVILDTDDFVWNGTTLSVIGGGGGSTAWGDVTGKPFTNLVDLVTPSLVWDAAQYPLALTNAAEFATAAQGLKSDSAWQNPPNATNFTWTTNNNEITITSWLGTGGNAVVIPDMLDGLPVVAIGGSAFDNTPITSVSGGANVKSLENYAFYTCYALTSVSLPAATTISQFAFGNGNSLTNVYLPSATSIGLGAFYRCVQLTSVNLPAATIIGNESFYNCTSLTSVSLPAATSIGVNAFAVCTQLTNVTFSAATVPIGMFGIFAGSTNVVVYVTNPTATGWGPTFSGQPVVRLGVTAESATITGTNTAAAFVQSGTNLMTQITTLQSATNSYVLTNSTAAVTVGSLTATGEVSAGSASVTGAISAEQLTSTDDANITDTLTVGTNITLGASSLAPFTVNRSRDSDFVGYVYNTSSSGFGMRFRTANNANAPIQVLSADGSTAAINLHGDGAATFRGAGLFGIGTNAPATKLHVVGNARVDGNVTNSGTLSVGGAIDAASLATTGNITAGNMTLGGVTITNWPSGGGTFTNLFSGAGTTGSVTSESGDTSKFLRGDGTWQTVAGGSTPTLQAVTDEGASTTHTITAAGFALTGNRRSLPTAVDLSAVTSYTNDASAAVTSYTFGTNTTDFTFYLTGPGTNYMADATIYFASGYTNRAVTITNATGSLKWIGSEPATTQARILVDWIGTDANLISTWEE